MGGCNIHKFPLLGYSLHSRLGPLEWKSAPERSSANVFLFCLKGDFIHKQKHWTLEGSLMRMLMRRYFSGDWLWLRGLYSSQGTNTTMGSDYYEKLNTVLKWALGIFAIHYMTSPHLLTAEELSTSIFKSKEMMLSNSILFAMDSALQTQVPSSKPKMYLFDDAMRPNS